MALIIDASYKAFDTAQIQRGDCVRIRRTGDTTARNGFVTEVTPVSFSVIFSFLAIFQVLGCAFLIFHVF